VVEHDKVLVRFRHRVRDEPDPYDDGYFGRQKVKNRPNLEHFVVCTFDLKFVEIIFRL